MDIRPHATARLKLSTSLSIDALWRNIEIVYLFIYLFIFLFINYHIIYIYYDSPARQHPLVSYLIFLPCWPQTVASKTPSTHVSGYFWIRNFFFPDSASVHTYSVNTAYESAVFWIRSSEWKFLNKLLIWNRVDAKSGNFLTLWRNKINPSSLPWKAEQHANFVRFTTHALSPIFPEESWVLELIRKRVGYVWTGKFDLNPDTCGRGNFWIGKEKFTDSKVSRYVRVVGLSRLRS